MKLVTFEANGNTAVGALETRDGREVVIDLSASGLPTDMLEFLRGGQATLDQAKQAVQNASGGALLDAGAVTIKAPIKRPGKIMCIGLNYKDHAAESNSPIPDYPVVFCKYENAIVGPGDAIVLPRVTDEVDYEAELAFVIGKRGRYISEADAMDYVAGYTAMNDVSARDYQRRVSQWTMGKTFDTFGPIGPAIVTRDDVPDPHNLAIRLRIGDELLQDGNTRELIFNIPQLVASLSEVITLEPGDVVSTGTPPGVGFARTPPRWLRSGDVVTVEIEGVGSLTNPVVAES